VRNIVENANVRVKVNGRWRKGVASDLLISPAELGGSMKSE
jgi:hypothetical protein